MIQIASSEVFVILASASLRLSNLAKLSEQIAGDNPGTALDDGVEDLSDHGLCHILGSHVAQARKYILLEATPCFLPGILAR